ncbi:hypothetical protein CgunFtcFv8_010233 [Champsocephalus gunnari]|uniref:Uncharacterized protein n=1 Tax=Champsocephalus gunnari TaxID=52237 RepID=A0AAN8HVB7_CHAGU|nr:hypothetical protein CgunFtcFv8_010233 [Champsocephalus gunnari]
MLDAGTRCLLLLPLSPAHVWQISDNENVMRGTAREDFDPGAQRSSPQFCIADEAHHAYLRTEGIVYMSDNMML